MDEQRRMLVPPKFALWIVFPRTCDYGDAQLVPSIPLYSLWYVGVHMLWGIVAAVGGAGIRLRCTYPSLCLFPDPPAFLPLPPVPSPVLQGKHRRSPETICYYCLYYPFYLTAISNIKDQTR